jgi:uncharacterized protein (TIGR02145 family)
MKSTKFAQVAGIMLALTFTFSCSSDDGGSSYKTVKIGNQVWMAENLNNNVSGSKCYDNKSANCNKYGKLYGWDMAKAACPSGWHLPSKTEWETLINFVGGASTAGTKLKSKSGWNDNGNGTDDYGFSALPGGGGSSVDAFVLVGTGGFWWSSTESGGNYAYFFNMGSFAGVGSTTGNTISTMYSVRCVQD